MACTLLEITGTSDGPDTAEAWQRIAQVLAEEHSPDTPFEINDVPRKLGKVGDYIAKARVVIFDVAGAGFEFRYSPAGPRDASRIRVERKGGPDLDGQFWVSQLTESDWLLSAYVADLNYEYWQNADDPRLYGLAGKSLDGLALIPGRGPGPGQMVDVSRHPGRRVFRNGYIEAVGAVMWLGRQFAARTGADLDALWSADWCTAEEYRPGTLCVRTQEGCFTSSEGREGELQDRLRAALVPNPPEERPKWRQERQS